MFEDKQKQYNLTDDEVKKFCQLGCSVDCDIFLKEYARRLNIKRDCRDEANAIWQENE